MRLSVTFGSNLYKRSDWNGISEVVPSRMVQKVGSETAKWQLKKQQQVTDLSIVWNNKLLSMIIKTPKSHFQEVFIYFKKHISCSKNWEKMHGHMKTQHGRTFLAQT